MSELLRTRIFDALHALAIVDPHTHINPHAPASTTLVDILGYHYYTELAHSAGMPKAQIEEPGLDPREKTRRIISGLGPIENTIQYSWFMEIAREFFGFKEELVTTKNWEGLYDAALTKMQSADWAGQVLKQSKLEAVFLTNDFDDPLEGFDTKTYVPCLRTDDLVFHLGKPEVRARLEKATKIAAGSAAKLREALGALFKHFKARGARACAISLPPEFAPVRVEAAAAETALQAVLKEGVNAPAERRRDLSNFVFWTLAEYCVEFKLPFDLMIGVNRAVYPAGVFQGMDLYDSRVSLIQYKELFNAFPQVTFPVSVLSSFTNQELASYAWIFPNVVTNGHWWYSNTPTFIEHDSAARMEAVPRTKQVGYYSDMYKLEFALPKFAMYKRILAKILAERYVVDRGWSEERAVAFGTEILRDNTRRIFYKDE
ncbi:MAG: amidohydrolase [Pirellula sp.]|nr:amidohydrolase [Pirellula sp.]